MNTAMVNAISSKGAMISYEEAPMSNTRKEVDIDPGS